MADWRKANPARRGTNIDDFETNRLRTSRFELFIDLIWVGIIGNLAANFSEQAFSLHGARIELGRAVFGFIIIFLLAWRIWKFLQEFMSKYSTNDIIERTFVVWALMLAMLYGNNAPYFIAKEDQSNVAVAIYLVFKASLFSIEAYYSLHLPHIRRRCILQTALGLPMLALWIPAIHFDYPTKTGLAYAAVALEYLAAAVIEIPLAERFLEDDRKEILDTDHWVERIQDFYIIVLGEGVLNLIRGSPLGHGIARILRPQWPLLQRRLLSKIRPCCAEGLVAEGSLALVSNTSCHMAPVGVRGIYRRLNSFHVVMFASTLTLGVSIAFMIQHPHTNTIIPDDSDPSSEEFRRGTAVPSAKWTVSVMLSAVLICQTVIALLSRPLDGLRSMKIDNRYLRLLPRGLVIAVAACLPLARHFTAIPFLGILVAMLVPCILWEWYASLERGGGILEP